MYPLQILRVSFQLRCLARLIPYWSHKTELKLKKIHILMINLVRRRAWICNLYQIIISLSPIIKILMALFRSLSRGSQNKKKGVKWPKMNWKFDRICWIHSSVKFIFIATLSKRMPIHPEERTKATQVLELLLQSLNLRIKTNMTDILTASWSKKAVRKNIHKCDCKVCLIV